MPTDRSNETLLTQTPTSGDSKPAKARDSRSSIPEMLGRYRVIKLLGRGGVGSVYEAEDPEVGRRVAIKVLRDDKEGDTEALRGEAQALGRLVHPNVVTIHDVGVAGDDVFLVMQLVEGEPLDRWLASRATSPREILAMFRQAGLGLAAAHAAGLVHCDFKPGNILVDRHGVVRVSDFGLARATRAHAGHDAIASASMVSVSGTPAYMAPEQFDGVATAATDQFAYCVALWEVLAGERPFEDSSIHVTDIHASRGPVRELPKTARIPSHLVPVLERGLAPVPGDRYASMDDLLAALAKPAPRGRQLAIAGAVVGVLAAGGIAAFALTRDPKPTVAPVWNAADVASARVLTTAGCDDSPVIDGTTVVFGRTSDNDVVDVFSIPLAGGKERQLTSAPTWEWRVNRGRRDGEITYLIHDGKTDQGASIAYLDLATGASSTAQPVYAWDATVSAGALVYSPDSPAGIRRVVDQKNMTFLDPPAEHAYMLLSPSPKNDLLATTRTTLNGGPTQPCTVDLATNAITCSPTRSSDGRPAFGADGRSLYFSAEDGLRRRDLVTGNETVFLPGVWSDGGIAVAPDGSALVYSMCRGLYSVVDATTAKVWMEGPNASEVSVSSAGAIAVVRDIKGVQILETRTPEGKEIAQLTTVEFGSIQSPVWSPDGTQIAFAGSGLNPGLHRLKVSNPGAPLRVTDDPADQGPIWTPGGAIAFTRTIGLTTYAFVYKDRAVRQLSKSTRFVYGNRGEELLVDTNEDGVDSLLWLDIATGAERPGPTRPEGFVKMASTSPDGAWIGFLMGLNGQDVWRIHVDGPGALEHVTTLRPGMTGSSISVTNQGNVLVTQSVWAGGLHVIPARPGTRF